VPTIPGTLEEIEDAATHLLVKLEKLPFEQIGKNLLGASEGLNRLMNDPELEKILYSAHTALTSVNKLAQDVDRTTLPQIEKTLLAFDEDSPAYVDLADMLEELAGAARSMRVFADYIEQHPDALIKGKR
jgi:paraquat-inducible protein B